MQQIHINAKENNTVDMLIRLIQQGTTSGIRSGQIPYRPNGAEESYRKVKEHINGTYHNLRITFGTKDDVSGFSWDIL